MSAPGSSSNVIVRFMALLDVALILVGVLIVILLQIDPRSSQVDSPAPAAGSIGGNGPENAATEITSDAEAAIQQRITFINVLAGWQNERDGRAYRLTSDMKIGDEVPLDQSDWIDSIRGAGKENIVVLLIFERDGWFPTWTKAKVSAIQDSWDVQVIPIYNVSLPTRE